MRSIENFIRRLITTSPFSLTKRRGALAFVLVIALLPSAHTKEIVPDFYWADGHLGYETYPGPQAVCDGFLAKVPIFEKYAPIVFVPKTYTGIGTSGQSGYCSLINSTDPTFEYAHPCYASACPKGYYFDFKGQDVTFAPKCVDPGDPIYRYTPEVNFTCKSIGPDRAKNQGSCETRFPNSHAGNLIETGIGNKYQAETDYVSAGPGKLVVRRYYNSTKANSRMHADEAYWRMGMHWGFHYDRRISLNANAILATAAVYRPDGKVLYFNLNTTLGRYEPDADIRATLDRLLDGAGAPIGWRYTTDNDTVETYDTTGKLQTLTDRSGRTQTLDYALTAAEGGDDNPDTLDRVTDAYGATLGFSYDTLGRVVSISAPNGTYAYTYNARGSLEYVIYPDATPANDTDNPRRQYHYENTRFPYALTGITDERGIRYANWEYDTSGRATASYHGPQTDILTDRIDGITIAYVGNTSRTVTNSLGQASTYTTATQLGMALVTNVAGPGCSSCGTGDSAYEYDPLNNNLLAKTVHNQRTEYGGYDAKGQYTYKIEAAGTADARRTDYTYDPRFHNKITTRSEPSVRTPVDAAARKITTTTFDNFGNPIAIKTDGYTPDGTPVSRTTTYQYNGPLNQLSQIDGPRTDVIDITTLTYYADDPLEGANRARLKRITNALGQIERDNIVYSASGRVLSETRLNGLALSYTFDARDRLETLTETAGASSRTTRWTYLATGEVETVTLAEGTSDARVVTLGYDAARRLVRITDALGNRIDYTLDTEGNTLATEHHDPTGALKKTLAQTFDTYNHLDTLTEANQSLDYDYNPDGTLGTLTTAAGVTSYTYDQLKRLTTTVEDQGSLDADTADTATGYAYDTNDALTTVTDARGNATGYTVDDLGNRITLTSPDTGTTAYSVDDAGNTKTLTDARGITATYTYDALNRLKAITYPDAAKNISYTYDQGPNGLGRLTGITDSSGSITYAYDTYGQLIQETHTINGVAYTTGYTYTDAGELKRTTYPSGRSVEAVRDAAGQITTLTQTKNTTTTTLASSITYAPFGPQTGLTYGNGLIETRVFDTDYRLKDLSVKTAAQTPVETRNLVYDTNGRLTDLTTVLGLNHYQYDALDRLTQDTAAGSTAKDLKYDPVGNRISQTQSGVTQTHTIEATSNRHTAQAGAAITYDAAGHRKSDQNGARTYTIDDTGRLVEIKTGATVTATYTYNALGQRVSKTTALGTVIYHYDPNGQLIAETQADGTLLRDYVYLNGQPLAQIDIGQTSETVLYLHTDHLGTPRSATNAAQTPVWRWEGEAFGNTAANEDPDGDGISVTINLRFPGQYFDVESGFHYNYFRYYDPSSGRYITSDPIGLEGGINTFGYVKGNPLLFADRYGLQERTLPWNAIPRSSPTSIPKPMGSPKSPWLLLIVPNEAANGECIGNPSCEAAYAAMINSVTDGNICPPVDKNKSSNNLDCSAVRRNCIKQCLSKLDSPDLQSTPFHKCVADCLFDAGC